MKSIIAFSGSITLLAASPAPRTSLFDADWKFHRGDVAGAEAAAFDDSGWRTLDVPHDWSIEDLPPKDDAVPELEAVAGEWKFQPGDEADWKAADFDDRDWKTVTLPDTWENHGQSKESNVYGWYRRSLEIPADLRGKDFVLLLGRIDDVDETFVNGERVGGTGSFPPHYRWADQEQRRYPVSASQVGENDTIQVAVRVFDGENTGGIHAAGIKSERIGPFDPAEASNRHFTAFTVGGTGWYRKHFKLGSNEGRTSLLFEGVSMNPEIWLNGQKLGEHPHAYTSFEVDLTSHLKPAGQVNVLAVKVRNEGRNSRWYAGSGIYRHVRLTRTDRLHIPTWGVFVTTPDVSREKAAVHVSVEVTNERPEAAATGVQVRLLDPAGKEVAMARANLSLPPATTLPVSLKLAVDSPECWSPPSPDLYLAETTVVVAGKEIDRVRTPFGIRSIEVDAKRGFVLNGEPLLLKGGCVHHDLGPLGAAAIDRAVERKIELMKKNGYNAVRTSHNPPSPALLDACDRLGLLVIDEAFDQWIEPKEGNLEGYQRFFKDWHARDLASMVRRDRNHPSVVMWSVGNEIPEQFRAPEIGRDLRAEVLKHDTTRPITQAFHRIEPWEEVSKGGFEHLDIAGYNYLPDKYESDHERHPDRVIVGTESYPKDAYADWSLVEKHPYVIGDFVWTAWDYLGEAGLAHSVPSNEPNPFFMGWPWFNAWSGDLDLCGFKKPQSYYRDVIWGERRIALFVHQPIPDGLSEVLSWWAWPKETDSWNWPGQEGKPLQVSVYSRCEKVRLELDGKVIDEQPVSGETKLTARFQVPYRPGELKAIGLENGKPVAEATLVTTGRPAAIRLTADRDPIRADRNDLSYVTVEIVDAQGRRVPDARVEVDFSVSGNGELAAQGSAVPNEPASFQQPRCKTWQGRCIAILRPDGEAGSIRLEARAEGLESATLTVTTR
ncbi:glycoside hydrolase family 2 TIM barrel-domain containing protein [Haloferula sargassicola]|uniref:Beta-galactosidase n=1 Tax=Haloferula sargassicola TaxID=490096 RepID=A0ABP9UR10_9BACT